MLPAQIVGSSQGIFLEAYSPSNQEELWRSIVTDRENPKRKGIWPGIKTFEALKAYMESCDLQNPASEEYGYIVRDKAGRLAGTFHIFSVNWVGAIAEVGYGLHHAYEGQGLATAALLLVENVLRERGFREIKITCQSWNTRSWAVAERSSFALVDTFHKGRARQGCDDCTKVYKKRIA